jgi:hypothetical protein
MFPAKASVAAAEAQPAQADPNSAARKLLSSQLANAFTSILQRQAAALAWCTEHGLGDISNISNISHRTPGGEGEAFSSQQAPGEGEEAFSSSASRLAENIEASPAALEELVAVLGLMRGEKGGRR